MGLTIGNYIGIGKNSGISLSQYWASQSEVLFFGLYSEISGGQMPNKVTGATDFLTVAGSAGSETYQCPNTAAYIAADTDYIWFKADATQRTTTTAELIGYDLQRTPIKYNDTTPNAIVAIMILKSGETITGTKRDKMFKDFWLPIMWDNSLSAYGHVKDNRGATQQLWTVEPTTAEVILYTTGLTTPLSSSQIIKLDTFVSSLKTGLSISNLSDVFDCMWILAGETEESSLKNIVKDAHHCTNVHTTAFTALEGFKGDGANDYLNTVYNPAIHADNLTINSNSLGVYIRTNDNGVYGAIGLFAGGTGNNYFYIYPRLSDVFYYSSFSNANGSVANLDSRGMYINSRTAANLTTGYKNGNSVDTDTTAPTAISSRNVYICAIDQANAGAAYALSISQIAFAFIARGITGTEAATITNVFEAYMDSNGKGVIT